MFFPTMYLLHLHLWFRIALGFTLCSRLTYHRMPNAVPVRQVSGLPRASFRSCLATDTLASSYALGATSCARDFHPLDHAHAGRTSNKDQTHMHLILCGSSYSMMKKIFEDNREPLFGRATTKIHLQPFAADKLISLVEQAPVKISNDDLLALYSITGGVALYVADFVDNGIFHKEQMFEWTVRPGSLFLSEGYDLLRLEVEAGQSTYISILRALAHGQTQAPRIADLIGVSPLNSYLERLELYGFIEKMRPILAKPNSRSVRWQICDPFLRFWFRYIEGNQDLIENGMSSVLVQDIAESYETFSGPMLERFFRQKLIRTGKYTTVGSWWKQKRGAQGDLNEIDLIAIGRDRKSAFVAEVKRQKKSFREGVFLDKVEHLKKSVLAGYDVQTAYLTLEDLRSPIL